MSERAPYSRLYWSVMDDPKFDGIREDVRLFGSWGLLLLVADMAWPVPAFIPPTIPRAAFARLVKAELVDELPGHRFRVHGLDKERQKRSDQASNAAALRWQASGNAPSTVETMPRRDRDETEHRQAERAASDEDPAVVYQRVAGRFPSSKVVEWLDSLSAEYGSEAVARKLAATWSDGDPAKALSRTQDALKADARASSRQRPRFGLQPGSVEAELAAEWARQEESA